jgi:O-antigen/teichoic acid export membrane protein
VDENIEVKISVSGHPEVDNQATRRPEAMPLQRLLHGSVWSVLQNVFRMGVSLVSVPLAVGRLGADRYGLWMLALSVASLISFMDAGLSPLLMNRLAESHARCDLLAFRRYVRAATALSVCLLILSVAATLVVANLDWPHLANVSDAVATHESRPLFATVVFFGGLGLALTPFENVMSARLQIVFPRVCSFAASTVSFGLLLLGLHLHVSLPILAAMVAAPTSAYRLLLLPAVIRSGKGFGFDWAELWSVLRELLPSSSLFLVIVAAATVTSFLPNITVARYFGLAEVAVLSVAMRLVSIPVSLIAAALPNFWPAFTIAWHRKNLGEVRKLLGWACGLTLVAMGMCSVFVTLVGPWFILRWTGGRIHVDAALLFALGCWATLQALFNWLSTFLHSITDLRFEVFSYASTAILTAALLRLAAPRGSMLLLAVAMAIPALATGAIPMSLRVRHWLQPLSRTIE